MGTPINSRVIAIKSFSDGVLEVYGVGTYIGNYIPEAEPFVSRKISNPCIRLDNGEYVWGFMCWWGDEEEFMSHYGKHIEERKFVPLEDNIKPIDLQKEPME